jgi:hypothetical protein
MLRADTPTQVTHSEFLKQREEICTMLRCHLETTSSNSAGSVSRVSTQDILSSRACERKV